MCVLLIVFIHSCNVSDRPKFTLLWASAGSADPQSTKNQRKLCSKFATNVTVVTVTLRCHYLGLSGGSSSARRVSHPIIIAVSSVVSLKKTLYLHHLILMWVSAVGPHVFSLDWAVNEVFHTRLGNRKSTTPPTRNIVRLTCWYCSISKLTSFSSP